MSYSISVRAATAALAVAAVAPKFDEDVIAHQPVHAKDRDVAVAAATAMAGLLAEPADGKEVSISVSGWLQWQHIEGGGQPDNFTGANVSVSASIVDKAE